MAEPGADRFERLSPARRALLEQRLRGKPADAGIPRRPDDAPLELSTGQQRLWFLHQLDPAASAYNMYTVVRLSGPLDVDALQSALHGVVMRHEILRTAYPVNGGRPAPTLCADAAVRLRRVDLAAEPHSVRERRARDLAGEEVARPFDLATAPLFRALLVRLDETDHVLALTLHHIVADEWSLDVLWAEIAAGCAGETVEPPAVQFGDWAAWQRARIDTPAVARQIDGWADRLLGATGSPMPEPDHPRSARQRFHGALESTVLPADLTAALGALARNEGVTPFVLLLTAFEVLLHRCGDATDIVVGTPATGRNRSDLDRSIGFFINTLVLRTDLSGDPPFREALARVRDIVLHALAHQDAPFEAIVDALGVERRMDRNPLFQAMFVLRQPPRPKPLSAATHASPFAVEARASKFDLTLFATEAADGIELMFEYDSDLFEPASIRLLLERLEVLLHGLAHDPEQRLSALPLLSERERSTLATFSTGAPAAAAHGCIHARVIEHAGRAPDALAMVAAGRTMTYGELSARAGALAHSLRSLGVGPGHAVGVYAERSAEMLVALFGILEAGGAYVPLDPGWPVDRLRFVVRDTGAHVIVARQADVRNMPPTGAHVFTLDAAQAAEAPASRVPPLATADSTAYVIHTSGSTGVPKGIAVTHANLVHSTLARDVYYGAGPARFLLLSSFAFDSSVAGIFWTLATGGTLVLPPHRIEQDPTDLATLIAEQRVTHTLCLPTLHELLLDHADAALLRTLRVVIVAGEACAPRVVHRHFAALPGATLHNEYGPTEATVWSTVFEVPADFDGARVPIGRPIAGARAYVLDAAGAPSPIGVPGELHIGGPGVTGGYIDRPGETAARFIADPFEPGGRLYRTGDRVRWRRDGMLEFLGRTDRQFKVRGHRIEPDEIEAVLRAHPGVQDAVVVLRNGADGLVAALESLHPAEAARLLTEVERTEPADGRSP